MRKVLGVGLLVLCFMCTNAFAGGSGNCIQPLKKTTDDLALGVAFGYNYVDGRLMDLYNYGRDEEDVRVEELSQAYGQIPIGLNDTSNLIFKIGVCDYELELRDRGEAAGDDIRLDLDSGIYAGVGVNNLFPWKEFTISGMGPISVGWGYDLQGSGYINDIDSVSTNLGAATGVDGQLYAVDGQESIYVTARYDIEEVDTSIVPYIGLYHSWIAVGVLDQISFIKADNKTGEGQGVDVQGAFDALSFGLLLGIDLEITKYANLNVEGRFVGETAVTTGATIKF